ncbi:hypothetical protein KUH03_39005 [Sphingobacterium sp. E70]|nr:hypothetical protein [Sphingobacterium sp. E70]ULT24820.1 hypothetical protein KUH03_39005 [Sphingobacterium sp. E70]
MQDYKTDIFFGQDKEEIPISQNAHTVPYIQIFRIFLKNGIYFSIHE